MLDFSFYDLGIGWWVVGIDLKMPFRWLVFLGYLFLIVERTNFVRLRKREFTICIKTFAPTPSETC